MVDCLKDIQGLKDYPQQSRRCKFFHTFSRETLVFALGHAGLLKIRTSLKPFCFDRHYGQRMDESRLAYSRRSDVTFGPSPKRVDRVLMHAHVAHVRNDTNVKASIAIGIFF